MGSLMAGWNSPRNKRFQRTLSLTKEEIDHYWRNRRLDHSSHEEAASPSSPRLEEGKKLMQKSNTFTSSDDDHLDHRRDVFIPVTSHREVLKSRTFNGREAEVQIQPELIVGSAPAGWWTKTDLAFLNDRPVLEAVEGGGSKFKYTAQFHVGSRMGVEQGSSSAVVF